MKLNFNLRNKRCKRSTIYLVFTSGYHRLRVSTKQSIETKYWNARTQRSREQLDYSEGYMVNKELDRIMGDTLAQLHELKALTRKVGLDEVKKTMEDVVARRNVCITPKTFWDHFEEFVDYKRARVSKSVVKDYHYSLRKHLKYMEKRLDVVLTFDQLRHTVNGFCDELELYLINEAKGADGEPGMSLNTVGKINKNLKSFLNWCFERGVVERFSLKHLKTRAVEADTIYLTESEIALLEAVEVENELQDVVRDLFLIGCETGMRFSEFTSLSERNFDDDVVRVYQKKTKLKVTTPISNRFRRILEKYDYQPPTFENITVYNKVLRAVARKAGITQHRIQKTTKGNGQGQVFVSKCDLITSHTARRSFCTNKFLKEMPAHAIMAFSGHKSERTFNRYLKIDSEMAAKKYSEFF